MKINFDVSQLYALFNRHEGTPVPQTDSVLVVCVADKTSYPYNSPGQALRASGG
jgi:hypothetical protein